MVALWLAAAATMMQLPLRRTAAIAPAGHGILETKS
jgi:hypothetical protein